MRIIAAAIIAAGCKHLEAGLHYRRLELVLYGIVLVVSVSVGVTTERLDYRLQVQTLEAEVEDTNHSFAFRLEADISQLVAWANGMAAVVTLKPNLSQDEFSAAAERLGTNGLPVVNIALATDGIVRRVFPFADNALLLGTNLSTLPNQSEGVEAARQSARPILLGPLDLVQGRRGFIMRLALTTGALGGDSSDRWDLISIVVDENGFFEKIRREASTQGFETIISRLDDGVVIYGDATVLEQNPIAHSLVTPSGKWQVASVPSAGWPRFSTSAPLIAAITILRTLIVCMVLRTVFRFLRRQKAAEERLSVAIEALDDGFALFDADDRLVLSNSRYHEIYRSSSDLLVPGATFEEIIRGGVKRGQYPDALGQEDAWIARRLASHRSAESVLEQRLDDGRWLRVAERKTKDGGTVGFRVDITELKLATEAARAAERAKSDLISVLSHELRTPLTIVIGYISLVSSVGKLPVVLELRSLLSASGAPDASERLETVVETTETMATKANRSAHQLMSLINHLLDFSKIEAGKMRLDIADLDVASVLAEIGSSFRETIEGKGLKLEVASVATLVQADPIRIRQVLTNLMSNAVKFTDDGYIRLEASVVGDTVRFDVTDTGCGISVDLAARVFDRFEQVDSSSTRRAGGTGLGLSISKSLVEMMGGEIGFESTPRKGSRFWFTLPMSTKDA